MNNFQTNNNSAYDLEERTAKFGENIIDFAKMFNQNNINSSIINQLIRSGTSIGANYLEANGASSKKDFRNKIYICKKECNESRHWLRMLSKTNPEVINKCKTLWQEAYELTLIFTKIASTVDKKIKN